MFYKLTFKPGAEEMVFRLLQETPAVVSVKDVISVIQFNFKMTKNFAVLDENYKEMGMKAFIRTGGKAYRIKKKTNNIKYNNACK